MVATYLPRDDLKTFQTTPTVSSDGQMTSDEANLFIIYNMIYNSYVNDIYDIYDFHQLMCQEMAEKQFV